MTTTLLAAAPPAKDSAPNKKEWKAEIHTPAAEYNANLPMADIMPDPLNRKDHDQAALLELADQIKAEGLLQPILVRPLKDGSYEIIAGERRWLAHKLLKRLTIRAFIHKNETDLSHATKQLLENEGREDLNPIERARGYQRQIDLGMPQKDLVALLKKSQPVISNTLRLLELPAEVQKLFIDGNLSHAHGVELLRYAKFPKACLLIANLAIKKDTPAKKLADFPFGDELIDAKLAVDLDCWYRREQLPKELKTSPAVFDGENEYGDDGLYCFDVALGEKAMETERAKREGDRKNQSAGRNSDKPERTGMSTAELKARNKKIADNKQARLESEIARKAVFAQLKETKTIDANALVVIAEVAFEAHWKYGSSERVKRVAAELGIALPKGPSSPDLNWLGKLSTVDVLRFTVGCILDRSSADAVSFAWNVNDDVELVLGDKKTKAAKKAAADQLAAAAAAKAAKKGGAK